MRITRTPASPHAVLQVCLHHAWRRLIDWLSGAARREAQWDREMLAWLQKRREP
jgi:hypothetical protein